MAGFIQPTCQGYMLLVHVVPGASRTEVAGLHGGRLKVRVAAPPEKGAANEELLAFLSRRLGVPKKAMQILGTQSRSKTVVIHDLSPEMGVKLERLWPGSGNPANPPPGPGLP